jgi:tetratricopeptide (TPR) repeat protein
VAAEPNALLGLLLPVSIGILAAVLRGKKRRTPPGEKSAHAAAAPLTSTSTELEAAVAAREAEPPSVERAVLVHRLSQQRAAAGRLLEAEALARQVSDWVRDLAEVGHQDTLAVWAHHVALLRALGKPEEAEALQRRLLDLAKQIHPPASPAIIQQRVVLAAILILRGLRDEAASLLHEASAELDVAGAADFPEGADAPTLLGEIGERWFELGDLEEAERALVRKLALERLRLGEASPLRAPSFEALARVRRARCRSDEARRDLEQALALVEAGGGPFHQDVSRIARELGLLRYERGDLAAAETLLERSLAIRERHLGRDHGSLAGALKELAHLRRIQGRFAAAEASLRRAIALLERIGGPEHLDLVSCLLDLAGVLVTDMRHAEAETHLRRAVAIVRESGSVGHASTADALDALARFEASRGANAEAEALLAESLRGRERVLGPDHPEIAFRLTGIAELQISSDKLREAESGLQRALAILTRGLGGDPLHLVGVLQRLAVAHFRRGDLDGAIRRMQRALELAESAYGDADPGLLPLVESLANLLGTAGRDAEAEHNRARAEVLRTARRARPVVN